MKKNKHTTVSIRDMLSSLQKLREALEKDRDAIRERIDAEECNAVDCAAKLDAVEKTMVAMGLLL